MTTTTARTHIRIADAIYSRPLLDGQLKPFITVEYDDGERFATYYIGRNVLAAWALADSTA